MAKKQYIITYSDLDTDVKAASTVMARAISTKASAVRDGIAAFAAAQPFDEYEKDVLVFEGIGCGTATLTDSQVKKLEDDPGVLAVEEDVEVHALSAAERYEDLDQHEPEEAQQQSDGGAAPAAASSPPFVLPTPWNVSMVKADRVWRRTRGHDVKVAIIDTGIDDDHPDLSVYDGASFVSGVGYWNDDHGHGTHCAGIAGGRQSRGFIGVAPACHLYAVKVLTGLGSGMLSWVIAGMGWARQNGMDVASMSLGIDVASENAPCSVAFQAAAQTLIDSGCIIVAAAGNAGREVNHWVGQPARCPGFMAVGSVDHRRQLSDFSSWGSSLGPQSNVEIVAPGSRINSTRVGGGHRLMSGTSMACPHVAGAAALLKQLHPSWPPVRIRNRLNATATDLGAPGNDPKYGNGLLDCEAAVFGPP
ncbi:S8 family peptidase [Pelagibius sp.]|uniref:S8 family peptidase n=1 Tax=Pelagibius sp. TaxID=1931238 RepID=UPI00262A0EB0|nr:S8 family peptidase [Pelagibius sp.]